MAATLPETAKDWLEFGLVVATVIGGAWSAIKWGPGAIEAWGTRRAEKRKLNRGLIEVVSRFPEFIERLEEVFGVIAENGKRLLNIEHQQNQQTVMMHSIIETLPEETVWTNASGDPIAVSQGFTAMTGMDLAAMKSGGWKRMIAADDLDRVEKAWEASRKIGETFRCIYSIHNVQYPARGEFEIECLAIPMKDKSGWKASFARTADEMTNAPVSMSTNTPVA